MGTGNEGGQGTRRTVILGLDFRPLRRGESVVIGRQSFGPDGTIESQSTIGRQHLSLFLDNAGAFWGIDLASTNGTKLNGVAIPAGVHAPVDLSRLNRFMLGKVPLAKVSIRPVKYILPPGFDPAHFILPPGAVVPIPAGMSHKEFFASLTDTDYYSIALGVDCTPFEVEFTVAPSSPRTAEQEALGNQTVIDRRVMPDEADPNNA